METPQATVGGMQENDNLAVVDMLDGSSPERSPVVEVIMPSPTTQQAKRELREIGSLQMEVKEFLLWKELLVWKNLAVYQNMSCNEVLKFESPEDWANTTE
ncbi:hypothetical protein E2562_009271 [Oryza meyeriana var. granulata]|uniref:Uncharacterized protein n=1 Tax=Oryza meyeriana var. granulata TaxID=110450 RepID=A0A6G1E9S4_9ORYZ|nr:hypothetical protein E2562_009271 [Oryza meyeriana var. granulata]